MGPGRFRQVMSGDVIALDEAALAISATVQPGLDEIEWLAALDSLAADCPTPTADGIARHLFDGLGFSGNARAYYDWRNSCLDRVIQNRVGIPISLSVLMIEVGRRLGVELVGIGMPAHFLVATPDTDVFYDPFDGARRLRREDARAIFERVTRGQVPWREEYLSPTPTRAIVVRMLNNLTSIFTGRRDTIRLAMVMQLRAILPEIADDEADEIEAAVAVLN